MSNLVVFQMSCRKDFVKETKLMEDSIFPYIRRRGQNAFYPVNYRERLFEENESYLKSARNVLLMIHGYRSIYENVERKYNLIQNLLAEKSGVEYDIIVEYYWPGSWEAAVGFVAAYNRAPISAKYLSKGFLYFMFFLEKIMNLEIENVTVSAHSLGCFVSLGLFSCADLLPKSFFELNAFKNLNLVHASPAVNKNDFKENTRSVDLLTEKLNKYLLFSTKKDNVLKFAYRTVPSNWFSPSIAFSPDSVPSELKQKMQHIDLTEEISGHGNYHKSETYLKFPQMLL